MSPRQSPPPSDPVRRVPAQRGGWWHAYVCPVHHVELDPAVGEGDARRYPCPHGCLLSGEPYAGAWLVFEHQACARRLRLLARWAADGDAPAADEAVALAREIASLYARLTTSGWHEEAEPWMLRGTLFHQALTEAIWATSVGHGCRTLLDAIDGDRRQALAEPLAALFTGVGRTMLAARDVLVDDRDDFANNYTAWLNAAGVAAARVLERLERDVEAGVWLEGSRGQFAHVLAATMSDGWEWEGATYYHVFVLRAYLLSLRGMNPRDLPEASAARLRAMLAVLPAVADAGGGLPALHDSPYRRRPYTEEILEVAVLGSQLCEVAGLERVAAAARAELGEGHDGLEDRLGGWFAGPPAAAGPASAAGSVVFRDAGYAVLRSPDGRWNGLVDFGPHGGAHGHLDKLALYLYADGAPWQPDYGITPYASTARQAYAATSAHPAFQVDGVEQRPCAGRLERWHVGGGGVTEAVVAVDAAYDGVLARRFTRMEAAYLLDLLLVTGERDREVQANLRPGVPLAVAALPDGGHRTLLRSDRGDLRGLHRCSTHDRLVLAPGPGPADDPSRSLFRLDWHARGRSVAFASVWQPEWAGPRAVGIAVASTGEPAVTVTLEDGSQHHHGFSTQTT